MRTKVLSDEQLRRLRRHPAAYRVARRLRFAVGALLPPVSVAGVPGRIHRNDFMLGATEHVDHYASSAQAVLTLVDSALERVGGSRTAIGRWLDFGCGYGRVLRYLVQDVDPSAVWVTDTIPAAVRFCAREFGVNPVLDLHARADLRASFDFIYAISVFTHLPLATAETTARLLASRLAPGGVILFTTHGPSTLSSSWRYGPEFADREHQIREALDHHGACFLPYAYRADQSYGVTWHVEPYVHSMVERSSDIPLRLIDYRVSGLENHQDVYVYQRDG